MASPTPISAPSPSACITTSSEPSALPARARLEDGIALQRRGDLAGALALYSALLAERPYDAAVLHYRGLLGLQLGELQTAREFLSKSLALDASSASAWSDFGSVCARQASYSAALEAFREALRLDPHHADALNNTAAVLKKLHRAKEAIPYFERLLRIRPRAVAAYCDLAAVWYRCGNTAQALLNYQRALQLAPDNATARAGLADVYESLGKFEPARAQYLAILRRNPEHAGALAKLLHLRGKPLDERWVEKASALAARPGLKAEARIRLNVALGHYHDRAGRTDAAFHHLSRGCDEQFRQAPFSSAGYTRAIDSLIETLDADFFRRAPTSGLTSARPIFIIGMPRSGTTLLEQILASHPRVAAGGELSMLLQVSYRMQQLSRERRPYPAGMRSLDAAALRRMAEHYLAHLDTLSATAAHVTDKLPFNFMHVGLIALLFPNAKIIHCRREPLDNCLSCFFTSFAEQIQFANHLGTLGRYYSDYARLMRHWHAVLPGRIFDMQYEQLVSDTESRVRALLEWCDLPWHEACLRFHQTERGVRTPSRWQVRQPMYSRSVQRWRPYERHLQPLIEALGPLAAQPRS